jgi:hypothetical protein
MTPELIEHQRSRQTASCSESDADPDRSRGPVPDPRRLLLRRGHPGSVGVSARPLVLDPSSSERSWRGIHGKQRRCHRH